MTFELRQNPAFAGRTPRPLEAMCHDRTPFITIVCECGFELHIHESSLAASRQFGAGLATRCHQCRELLTFPPGLLEDAFQEMRDEGWIA